VFLSFSPSFRSFDEAIKSLISGKNGTEAAVEFLDHFYTGSLFFDEEETEKRLHTDLSLHRTVYNEVTPDAANDWSDIADFCAAHGLPDVAIEITSAITVKESVGHALFAIAQREKEEFDYYT